MVFVACPLSLYLLFYPLSLYILLIAGNVSLPLQKQLDVAFLSTGNMSVVELQYNSNAAAIASSFWQLSDQLVMSYADGFCNGCGRGGRHLGYSQQWLDRVYTPPLDEPEVKVPMLQK